MLKRSLHTVTSIVFLFFWSANTAQTVDVQNFRTIDGKYNNLTHTTWGSAKENLIRNTTVGYADGISVPGGQNRPNPRVISNTIFSQSGLINDPMNLSDFFWVFGQFIDHDFGLTDDGSEPAFIQVPKGDSWMDPAGSGHAIIPMTRNVFDPATGTDIDNPRRHPNEITAYIDGSGVYGSDDARAAWLRTFSGGKLKVSAGNMLPYNTTTGEFDAPIDPNAPKMANPVGLTNKLYVAGDVRANENPLLLAFHTLFVREHNRQCDELAQKHPDWTDEQLYQHARKMVSGIIQSIVYKEWLPTMGVNLPAYRGYQPTVNAQLSEVFTAAAFRLGHTLLNGTLRRITTDGQVMPEGHVALRDAFFNPGVVAASGGIEVFLQGMATQTMQRMDARVIDDVRNFLFGPPGAGGLDLAAININRGRERGLPDFNTVRRDFGLQPYYFFQQINFDPLVVVALNSLYKSIDNIDPWVGMLAEYPMRRALFGETLMTILSRQFTALRDGDRFFYLNDPVLTEAEKRAIDQTAFHDVIMRNTSIKLMQNHVFQAIPYSNICDDLEVVVIGRIASETGEPVAGVDAKLGLETNNETSQSDHNGLFTFGVVPGCEVRNLRLAKEDNPARGITTLDLILVQKHILGIKHLDSPYKMMAADLNHSGNISTLDIITMRKLILGLQREMGGPVWEFIPADHPFASPENPFATEMPEQLEFEYLSHNMKMDYVAIKMGDINMSAMLNSLTDEPVVEVRSELPAMDLVLTDEALTPGQSVTVAFTAEDLPVLEGYQFGLRYDVGRLELEDIQAGSVPGLTADHFGVFAEEGRLTTSWHSAEAVDLPAGQPLFTLTFRALATGRLSEVIHLSDDLEAAVYDDALQAAPVQLHFANPVSTTVTAGFALYQNHPNPVTDRTVVPFFLPEAGSVRLTVFDAAGRTLLVRDGESGAGMQEWALNRSELPASGVCYYQVKTNSGAATLKMLLIN